MAELARLVTIVADLLTPTAGNDTKLTTWISDVRAADLRTEGVNTRTKRIMRQMHGRASFALRRHRILLQ